MSASLDTAKTALLFPGVGAQQADMFAAFRIYPEYGECVNEVSDVSGVDLHAVIHGERREALQQVRISQLALTATTVAVARILRRHAALVPDFVMGHSLGQYPALCAAGYLDLATVTRIVSLRSEAVEACASSFKQADMCWVLHVPADTVQHAVDAARREEGIQIHVSAIDAYDQATISGEMSEIRRFAPRLEAQGALFFPLRIGGPFHSPLMEPARARLEDGLAGLPEFAQSAPQLSRLVCNVSAAELAREGVKSSVLQHLVSPVQWLRSQQYLAEHGITRYLEISPKAVLTYLVERARLPMQACCEPQALFSWLQEASSSERRQALFFKRCCFHLYSEKVPGQANADAQQQLRRIRSEVRQSLTGAAGTRQGREFLWQRARQWLDVVEAAGAGSRELARQSLQSLYEAAER
jgi:[acyl-carrier-protein] S-malonyltransferase